MNNGLVDKFGRKHEYLRISVTDRCNLRCAYCMGMEGVPLMDHSKILHYEEIIKVVRAAAELGITRIRLTGGEPLARKGLERLVGGIAEIPGIRDISMTTNGILLPPMAATLKKAGLNRVNISLDSLKPDVYREITRLGNLADAQAGIFAALEHGLHPVKINVVLMQGVNDEEIPSFLRLAQDLPLKVRFIEYMPIDSHDNEWRGKYLPLQAVLDKAREMGFPLTLLNQNQDGGGPAEMYSMPGALGAIGLIRPISQHFCSECNRLRLTAEGHIKPCLYWQDELSVRPVIDDPDAVKALLQKALDFKRKKHEMSRELLAQERQDKGHRGMSAIGG
ncbi:MAG: GTP 3',8-cyclase MoaA [Clostridia bacterium]|nr:GTP 3',8-cyclase MoaA [Clostridia bacterium]